jgi:hypothetical protein
MNVILLEFLVVVRLETILEYSSVTERNDRGDKLCSRQTTQSVKRRQACFSLSSVLFSFNVFIIKSPLSLSFTARISATYCSSDSSTSTYRRKKQFRVGWHNGPYLKHLVCSVSKEVYRICI